MKEVNKTPLHKYYETKITENWQRTLVSGMVGQSLDGFLNFIEVTSHYYAQLLEGDRVIHAKQLWTEHRGFKKTIFTF